MRVEESKFEIAESINDNILHKGYDFRGRTMLNTLSGAITRNHNTVGLIVKIEAVVNHWFMSTRNLQVFRNIALKKNDKKRLLL